MNGELHPLAPSHLPYFIPAADGSDTMLAHVVIFLLVIAIGVGVAYLHVHALPERMAHQRNHTQLQLIAILALLALFTHNNLFWVVAVLLAAVRPPDVVTPLNSIARSLQRLAFGEDPPPEPRDEPAEEAQQATAEVAAGEDDAEAASGEAAAQDSGSSAQEAK